MTRLKQGRLVQFQSGESWQVGHVMEKNGSEFDVLETDRMVLVRLYHTGEIVEVAVWRLEKYPASPIPEPTNTGRKD